MIVPYRATAWRSIWMRASARHLREALQDPLNQRRLMHRLLQRHDRPLVELREELRPQ